MDTPEYDKWATQQRELLAIARKRAKKHKTNQECYARRKHSKRVFYRKTCTKCNQSKSGIDFYQDKRNKDGLQSWCKICRKTLQK